MFFVQSCPLGSELKLLPSLGGPMDRDLARGKADPRGVWVGFVVFVFFFLEEIRRGPPSSGSTGTWSFRALRLFSPWFPPKGRQSFMIS